MVDMEDLTRVEPDVEVHSAPRCLLPQAMQEYVAFCFHFPCDGQDEPIRKTRRPNGDGKLETSWYVDFHLKKENSRVHKCPDLPSVPEFGEGMEDVLRKFCLGMTQKKITF